ncbi:MAG: hypothetical protein ABFC57_06680, partial [Veillonellales bacterium]
FNDFLRYCFHKNIFLSGSNSFIPILASKEDVSNLFTQNFLRPLSKRQNINFLKNLYSYLLAK